MNQMAILNSNSAVLAGTFEKVAEYIASSKAENTLKAYNSDWTDFTTWCETNNLQPLPATPETVALYLTSLVERGYKASTIERRLISISKAHTTANLQDVTKNPLVKETWAGIRRTIGTSQKRKKPVLVEDLKSMLETVPENLLGIRDRALLLLGFAGGFRRSELVSLDVEDLEFTPQGLIVNLKRSKTDQEGKGRKIAVPYGRPGTCPVQAIKAWLETSGINEGPLFRSVNRHGHVQPDRLSDKAVALVVKRYCEAIGLNPAEFGAHSLRAGLATSAAMAGASERQIMKQTGHRSEQMVRRYIREANLFRDNVLSSLL